MKSLIVGSTLLGVLVFTSFAPITVRAESAPAAAGASEVRPEMDAAYDAFRNLQKYIYSHDRFFDASNEAAIAELLGALGGSFHRVDERAAGEDPGYMSTLQILREMLDDARRRFLEGNKGYALWRLKTAVNYCVTCHVRHDVKRDFYDVDPGLASLSVFERAEFYFASRQFAKAGELYLEAAEKAADTYERSEALKKWLLIATRAYPDPSNAVATLNRLRSKVSLNQYEQEEVQSWLESLRRWSSEGRGANVPSLARARTLVERGIALNDPAVGRKGTVEILRGTAMLHKLLEARPGPGREQRAEMLSLLGSGYSQLPSYFVYEMPELFLEQCVRENPSSAVAQRCYAQYKDVVTLGYTGSGGVRIPAEVELKFKTLHDLAFGGAPQPGGRI